MSSSFKRTCLTAIAGVVGFLTSQIATAQQPSQPSQLLPRVYVSDVSVTADESRAITGSFTVSNSEGYAVGGLHYEILLLGPAAQGAANELTADTAPMYDRVVVPDVFAVAPSSEKTIELTYQAPAVPQGRYRLRIQLRTSNDRALGWADELLSFGGAETYAVLQPAAVVVDSVSPIDPSDRRSQWSPLEGVNVNGGQRVELQASARAVGTQPVSGTAYATLRRLLSSESTSEEIAGPAVTLQPQREQATTIPLNAPPTPGTYEAVVSLRDSSGTRISTLAEYRIVVRGTSASIVAASFDEFRNRSGEAVTVRFTVIGPADRQTSLPGVAQVNILNDSTPAGGTSVPIQFGQTAVEGTAAVTLEQSITSTPGLQIVLQDNEGTTLDAYTASFPDIQLTPPDQLATQSSDQIPAWVWIVIGIAGLILVGALAVVSRLKRTPPTIGAGPPSGTLVWIGLALGSIGLLVWGATTARATVVQTDCIDQEQCALPNVFVNSPRPRQEIIGDFVDYEINLNWLVCDCSVSVGYVSVYGIDGNVTDATTTSSSYVAGQDTVGRTVEFTYQDGRTFSSTIPPNQDAPASGVPPWTFLARGQLSGQPPVFQAQLNVSGLQSGLTLWTEVVAIPPAPSGSGDAACVAYAVEDQESDDSQFFTIDLNADPATTSSLGQSYDSYDIEGLDLHPTNGTLYAIAGDGGSHAGDLFTVDRSTGSLTLVGNIGYDNDVPGLSFRPDGTLWGWVEGEGLVEINLQTVQATVRHSSSVNMEGIAWNIDGTLLYGVTGTTLYEYNLTTNSLRTVPSSLPGTTEALEMRPDGLLMGGLDGASSVSIYAYDVQNGRVVSQESISTSFNDIEGIAWPEVCGNPGEEQTTGVGVIDDLTSITKSNPLGCLVTTKEVTDSAECSENVHHADVTITVRNVCGSTEKRIPLDVALVLDRSGSMEVGDKLADAKAAAHALVDELDPDLDKVTLVSYSDNARVDQQLTSDFTAIDIATDRLAAEGQTNIGDAVYKARVELNSSRGRPNDEATPVMLVLTDGIANRKHDIPQRCEDQYPVRHNACTRDAINQAADAKEDGIVVFTVGFGLNDSVPDVPAEDVEKVFALARAVLQDMASSEDKFFEASSRDELINAFRAIGEQITDTTVTDVVITDLLPDGVQYIPDSANPPTNNLIWDIGTLLGGQQQSVTFQVTFDPDFVNQLVNVDKVPDSHVTYEDSNNEEHVVQIPPGSHVPQLCIPPQCSDRIDNDGDGAIDCGVGTQPDPGCFPNDDPSAGQCNPNDNDEQHTPAFDPGGFQEVD